MIYTKDEINLIAVDSFDDLTYREKRLFLAARKKGGESAKYEDELIKSCGAGVYNKLREKFCDESYLSKIVSTLDKIGVRCITIKSEGYPEGLNHVKNPPLVLYARGNTELLKRRIFCVVGSRKSTTQAIEECKNISGRLAEYFVVATGIADGADSAAALGALDSGNVICVLPCGHKYSSTLSRRVEAKGLSLSEFPPDTRIQSYTFTLRNRILAGLSDGVLVVSAAIHGGALSTAAYAADYGKDVFAFPYSIGVSTGEGCNNLIKSGAYLCDSAEDILSVMGVDCVSATQEVELDDDERAVISVLKDEGEMHAEKLAAATGKKLYELAAICSSLEIKGIIVRVAGNRYAVL